MLHFLTAALVHCCGRKFFFNSILNELFMEQRSTEDSTKIKLKTKNKTKIAKSNHQETQHCMKL